MPSIHFIGGEKGGVGKSLVSRLLSQYHIDQNLAYTGIDADQSHGTLTRYYDEYTKPVNLDLFESTDQIMLEAVENGNSVVVDLPAQSERFLDRWIEDNGMLELAEELQLPVYYWYIVDDGRDSVQLLSQFLSKYQNRLNCIVVKNMGRGSDFSEVESLPQLQEPSNQLQQFFFPALHGITMHKVDKMNFSFWAAANVKDGPRLSFMERQRVKVWMKRAYQLFDQVITSEEPKAPEKHEIQQQEVQQQDIQQRQAEWESLADPTKPYMPVSDGASSL